MVRLPIVIMLALAGLLLTAPSVSGHAEYERSTPGRNEILPEPPARVDVYFAQEVRKIEGENYVRVFNDSDEQVSAGDGVVDDDDRTHIYAELPGALPPGRYVVQWRTFSDEDGDTDEGAFCFYVDTTPTADQLAECAQFDLEQEAPTTTPGPGGAPTTPPAELTATSPAPTATPEPLVSPTAVVSGNDDDGGANTGLIIGVIIAAVVAAGAIGGGVYWLRRRSA